MKRSNLSCAGSLIAITLFAANAAAQTYYVTSGSVVGSNCDPPNGFQFTWTGNVPQNDDWVGCYAGDYGYQSPETRYSPSGPGFTDGSEQANLAQSQVFEGDDYDCLGAFVWFERGFWTYNTQLGKYIWTCQEYTDYYYIYAPEGGCFAASTPLLTPDGAKSIEQFKVGDLVLSSPKDRIDASPFARRVTEVVLSHGRLLNITVRGQVVQATHSHPFYVKTKGWVPVSELKTGDLVRSHDNQWVPVESIVASRESRVYNLCVEDDSSYFVGGRGWGFSLWVRAAYSRPTSVRQKGIPSTRLPLRFAMANANSVK